MKILLTIAIFGACVLVMCLGALLKGRCLRGTCGGEPIRIAGIKLGCGECTRRETEDPSLRSE